VYLGLHSPVRHRRSEDWPRPDRSRWEAALPNSPGLAHVAFKIGDSTDDLRRAKAHLDALGVKIAMVADHTVSESIYIEDPDGNWIEVYVDVSDVWRSDPQAVATVGPLSL